jgi:hypothetical protein
VKYLSANTVAHGEAETETETEADHEVVVNLTSIWATLLPTELPLVGAAFYNFTNFDNSNLQTTLEATNTTVVIDNYYVQTILMLYINYYYLLTKYKVDPPDFTEQEILFFINFCPVIYDKEGCVENFNETSSVSNYNVSGGSDILFAISIEDYTVSCQVEFVLADQCGTFLEIHRPFDERIIEDQPLLSMEPGEFYYDYIETKNLCAGKYELWLVYRTLIGPIIQYIYPFFSIGPSCTCEQIEELGFICEGSTTTPTAPHAPTTPHAPSGGHRV